TLAKLSHVPTESFNGTGVFRLFHQTEDGAPIAARQNVECNGVETQKRETCEPPRISCYALISPAAFYRPLFSNAMIGSVLDHIRTLPPCQVHLTSVRNLSSVPANFCGKYRA